jgi:hypothetical protein
MSDNGHSESPSKLALKAIEDEYRIERLDDKQHVLIRPLQQEDRECKFQFIRHLSPQSVRARFLGTLTEPGELLMRQLMDADGMD